MCAEGAEWWSSDRRPILHHNNLHRVPQKGSGDFSPGDKVHAAQLSLVISSADERTLSLPFASLLFSRVFTKTSEGILV